MREINLSPLDQHFARGMARLDGSNHDQVLYQTTRLVCHVSANGHVCLDLREYAGQTVIFRYLEKEEQITLPETSMWISELFKSRLVGQIGAHTPFILDDKYYRFYLRRYWQYEYHLIQFFGEHTSTLPIPVHSLDVEHLIKTLFPPESSLGGQQKAVYSALRNRLSIITGGPGTGKTTTIINIMALLIANEPDICIKLTAPTGKAAARLSESIANGKKRLQENVPQKIWNQISEETFTIHRLLKSKRNSIYFHHDADNRLPIDCLILDEASMVDIALMSKLINALPDHCRLILLGDANQLSSVEAGAVFGDLCTSNNRQLQDKVTHLTHSYRFNPEKGIGRLSKLVLMEEGETAFNCLNSKAESQTIWHSLPDPSLLRSFIQKTILPYAKKLLGAETIGQAFQTLKSFAVLTALRVGRYGSINLNSVVETLLVETGLVPTAAEWYQGKPIMITRNDYGMGLFNGDLGICFSDPEENRLSAYFEKGDGYHKISPTRLPAHESVFALTIHKSQGSEFDEVMLVLPDAATDILTKELIYTGITRAKIGLQILGSRHIFIDSVSRTIQRSSGLKEGLDRSTI